MRLNCPSEQSDEESHEKYDIEVTFAGISKVHDQLSFVSLWCDAHDRI